MGFVKDWLLILCAGGTAIYTVCIFGQLMWFLSVPRAIPTSFIWLFNLLDNQSRLEAAFQPLVIDMVLLFLFTVQHSGMKSALAKRLIQKIGLASAERAIYSFTSSLCLQHLMQHWIPAQSIVLWQVDLSSSRTLWWTFVTLHAIAWVVIYGGSIIMDLPELLGIKGVMYKIWYDAPSTARKSAELRRLYTHVRHPSFLGLSVVLWTTNLMTLDRLLLALVLTSYMYFVWSPDDSDLAYQKYQLERKRKELNSQFF